MFIKSPCYKCTDRTVTCHVTCNEYIEYRKLVDEAGAIRFAEHTKDAQHRNHLISVYNKMRRCHHK